VVWNYTVFPSPISHYHPAIPFGNRKIYFRGPSSSVFSQYKKYHPPGNLKFNYFGIFQSLKLRISKEKNPSNITQAKFHSEYSGRLWVKILNKARFEKAVNIMAEFKR